MSVTAIISAYYAMPFLAARLANLQAQSLRPEIVAVCQVGSEECTLLQNYPEVVVIATDDVPTIYAAWNMAIEKATQEFITNANADDVLYPGALSCLIEALKDSSYALAYADCDIVMNYEGYPVGRYEWNEGGFQELLETCFIGPMPVWRRSLHEKCGFFDKEMRSAGDYEFWLRIASSGEKFIHLKKCLGAFYARRDSASMREPMRSTWETARARSRYNKEL